MRTVRRMPAAALVVAAGTATAACTSSAGSAAAAGQRTYPAVAGSGGSFPGSSVPAARPVPVPAGLYKAIPSACGMLGKATVEAIVPGGGAGSGQELPGSDIVTHICDWDASGPGWSRQLMVMTELDTGPDPRAQAAGAYPAELPDLGTQQAIRGLGDKAQLSVQRLKSGSSSAQLHVLTRNVVITVQYLGSDNGGPMTAAEMRNATVAAARDALTALS